MSEKRLLLVEWDADNNISEKRLLLVEWDADNNIPTGRFMRQINRRVVQGEVKPVEVADYLRELADKIEKGGL